MNAVEIEEAISALAEQPFEGQEFPFAFLQAFRNKETTLKRLRKGESNKSDLGGVRNVLTGRSFRECLVCCALFCTHPTCDGLVQRTTITLPFAT